VTLSRLATVSKLDSLLDVGKALSAEDDVRQGFDKLKEIAPDLAHLGGKDLATLLSMVGVRSPRMKAAFVSPSLSFQEARAASHEATAATIQARVDREAAWDRVKVVLIELGKVALKIAPLLMAVA